MASHSLRGRLHRSRPRPTRRQRDRRNAIIAVVVVVLVFVAALVLWIGRGGSGGPSAAGGPSGTPGASSGIDLPSATPSSTATGLPPLPGVGSSALLPNTTDLTTLGPGVHRVVMTARSNAPMLAVAYTVRGDRQGKIFYNVKSPVVISRNVTGGRPFGAIALQVSNVGSQGSCTITVDGKVLDTRSINRAYAVMGCAA